MRQDARRSILAAAATALALTAATAAGASERSSVGGTSLVLLTLDTTRADYLGCYGASGSGTRNLDALAAGGTRYARALTPSPLTLPAHASLLTGLEPPEHGLRDNGTAVLGAGVPTLATMLSARGYATGAFVASRVLDRRFGLDAGFDVYDDRMAAEQTGEYGYPERDAAAVTGAAIAWLETLPPARPFFLWVHYYDPHAPYESPAGGGGSPGEAYAGEIAYMDEEIGRLLAALPGGGSRPLVAAVGDHGEALGEHGEKGHGLFLYRASLEVPLMLSGPGVPAGRVVEEVVASRRLPATLLQLLGIADESAVPGPLLPGLSLPGSDPLPAAVYSETWMPATAYGWSPLTAMTDQRWRLIVAPRAELYDLLADPGETRNLIDDERETARRLGRELAALERSLEARPTAAPVSAPDLAADLRSLGYLSGSRRLGATIDPKDGLGMLAELERAKGLLQAGSAVEAAAMLRRLTNQSPGNVPFLTQLGAAELAGGNAEAALAAYRSAVALSPELDFLRLNLAEASLALGRQDEARREFERALGLDRRSARAWLGLAELAHRSGAAERERRLLEDAVAAGTASAIVRTRLGQIEAAAGDHVAADAHYRVATGLAPEWALAWALSGETAAARRQPEEARARYERAVALEPDNAAHLLELGKICYELGRRAEGRAHLERAAALAPDRPVGREARRLLASSAVP